MKTVGKNKENTEIRLAGINDIQIRYDFCSELKKRDHGKEFARELKGGGAVSVLPAGKKRSRRIVRRVRAGTIEIYRGLAGKKKRQNRKKAGKIILAEDKKTRMIALKQEESVRIEKNLAHLADQKKALETAMQNDMEKGKVEKCQRLISQIDLQIEKRSTKLRTLNFNIMMLRADRYINGYDIVKKDLVSSRVFITHKQFLSLSRTKKMAERRYTKMLEKEKKAQTLAGRIKNNTKALPGKIVKGTIKEASRAGKEKLTRELEKQEDLGNDAVKLVVESPGKTLEAAKGLKDGAGAMIRMPGRIVRGTWNTGKNIYRTGKAVVRGTDTAVKAMLKARQWALAFARSRQKAVMVKQAVEYTAKAAAEAAKMIAHTAVRILLFVIKGLVAAGLPVVIAAVVIIAVAAAVTAVTATVMEPYLDQEAMEAAADLCGDCLADYIQWTEEYRDSFKESRCYLDCDYDHNDTVIIQYVSGGYQTYVDKRTLIVYVAAYAKFGDISLIGQSQSGAAVREAEEIRNFMRECLEYLNPRDESLITGTDQRFREYQCREEEDSDGDYHHEHEYGEWRLKFTLRTEAELLDFLDFDKEQLETYHSMMSEFSKQVQEETSQEVAVKGFSLSDYFDFFGGSYTSGDVLAELVDLGDIELTEVTEFSLQYVGNPYVWGGNSLTNGVDCSGFVKAVYEHFGVTGIPRTSAEQSKTGMLVSGLDEAKPGDLIFYGQPVHHVALYLGGGQIVHASNSKPYPAGGIKVSSAAYSTITCIRRWVDE